MENNDKLPIKFQMALAHNEHAFSAFLKMDEGVQNEIIKSAQKLDSVREINKFVNSIPHMC